MDQYQGNVSIISNHAHSPKMQNKRIKLNT